MSLRTGVEIEQFCRDFLQGNSHHQLHEIVSIYRPRLMLDIHQMRFTENTFEDSFHRICTEIFIHRPVDNGYIIAILCFAVDINDQYHTSSWYNIDMLINSLINVLTEIGYDPRRLIPTTTTTSSCILL